MEKKKIGMLVAIAGEMAAVLRKFGEPGETHTFPGYQVLTYENETYTLYVLSCGAGEVAAAAGVQLLISLFHVELMVNFGVVGGLTQEMGQEKLCVVKDVVYYQFDTSEWDHIEPARYLPYPTVYIPTVPELVDRVLELHPELKAVTCASGDRFVGNEADKTELHEKYGAEICEMEAAAVVIICHKNNVPCLLMKAVSDGLSDGVDDFLGSLQKVAATCLDLTDRIIREL